MNMKKILFITPYFNGYEDSIKEAFEAKGIIVDMYSEKVNNGLFNKLFQFSKKLFYVTQNKYLDNILSNLDSEYDLLFVIKGEYLTESFFTSLCKVSNFKNKILYQWDSVLNNPNTKSISKFFDKIYTFDKQDALNYNFLYKPLFYTKEYSECHDSNVEFDFFFVGVFHSNRHKEISKVKYFARKHNLTCYVKLYMGFFGFMKYKLFNKNFSRISINDVIFKGLTKKEVAKNLHKSRIVIDIAHQDQNGLTIRTFEALGAGKKLITNNKNIQKESFYNTNIIAFLDDLEKLPSDFFEKNTQGIKVMQQAVGNWVDEFVKK